MRNARRVSSEDEEKTVTEEPTEPKINRNNSSGNEPFGPSDGEWALTNFILTVGNILMALILLWLYLRKKREGSEAPENNMMLLALIPAAASLIVFILTEDMSGRMVTADSWTAVISALFAADSGITYHALKVLGLAKKSV